MRQSGKPRPVSPSEITTACLQDELTNDDGQLRRGQAQVSDNGAPVPNPGGDIRQLFFSFFLSFFPCRDFPPSSFVLPRTCCTLCNPSRARGFSFVRNSSPPMTPFFLGRVQAASDVIASVQVSVPYIPIHRLNPQLFLMFSLWSQWSG